jgi:hypothetical protein
MTGGRRRGASGGPVLPAMLPRQGAGTLMQTATKNGSQSREPFVVRTVCAPASTHT